MTSTSADSAVALPRPRDPSPPPPDLVDSLIALEQRLDDTGLETVALLDVLIDVAHLRTACLHKLDAIRVERERLLTEEILGQQRSRKLLAQARQEMALQETWTAEIREVYARAALENIDLSNTSTVEEEAQGEAEEPSVAGDASREEVLNRQLLYLTHSMQKSERRLQALLDALRSLPSLSSTQRADRQLHDLATLWTNQLVALSVKRQGLTQDLKELRARQSAVEDKRDLVVLDLVLAWNALR